jgi:hypothetical protein
VVKTGLSSSSLVHGARGGAELCLSALGFSKDLHLMGWAKPKYLVKIKTDPSYFNYISAIYLKITSHD